MKHRNSTAPGEAGASSPVKRRKTSQSPPSTPVASSFKRRNSISSPSTPTRSNFMAISPISPIKRRDSVALDQDMNLKKSGKSKQKPISIVKNVGSSDDDDDQQQRAHAKSLESSKKERCSRTSSWVMELRSNPNGSASMFFPS